MHAPRPASWKWTVCGLLLLATMLNYMDRQTLAQLAKTICDEYDLSNQQYGLLGMGFGLAFAAGALVFGFLVDRFSILWLYPTVLIGWSLAGIATGYADGLGRLWLTALGAWDDSTAARTTGAYYGFMACRVALGFFEAGHWPCALVTAQRILARQDRSFGNSILQSGAALGAILTPQIVTLLVVTTPGDAGPVPAAGGWRPPFVVIGLAGMLWIVPWLGLVRPRDLARPAEAVDPDVVQPANAPPEAFGRRFAVLVIIVLAINATWQLFREWLPKFLQDPPHSYTLAEAGYFISAYYVATDLGCLAAGYAVKRLAGGGWRVHSARLLVFAVCSVMTMLSVTAAFLPRGPVLIGVLLIVGAGALGLFPNYYALTQDLSHKHQGKLVGVLGAVAWLGSSPLQPVAGWTVDQTGSYAALIVMAGLAPLPAVLALWLFWERPTPRRRTL
ncbi:MAG: MFS transporter, partial [Gemmataceae bacterium]|nr:MFS transporter [Gemmataceae bacterium]